MIPEIVEIAHREIAVIQTAGKPQNVVVERRQVEVVEVARQGPPGPASPVGGISADDGNALTRGGDGGLYVPDDIPADPLAYYILARS